jgi:hypothetical protein
MFTFNITLWRVRIIFLPPKAWYTFIRRGLYWRFIVACNSKICGFVFEVNLLIFLIDYGQIWNFSTFFYKSFKYQILRKYETNELRRFKSTDILTRGRLKMFFATWRRLQIRYITIQHSKAHQGKREMMDLWHVWILMPTHWWWEIWRKQSILKKHK